MFSLYTKIIILLPSQKFCVATKKCLVSTSGYVYSGPGPLFEVYSCSKQKCNECHKHPSDLFTGSNFSDFFDFTSFPCITFIHGSRNNRYLAFRLCSVAQQQRIMHLHLWSITQGMRLHKLIVLYVLSQYTVHTP